METSSLHSAVKKLAGNISGAYSYVFDGEDRRFLYSSSENAELEANILAFDSKKNIGKLVDHSEKNFIELNIGSDQRVLFVKRMATNLYFGLCVLNEPHFIQQAKKVMLSAFQVDIE